MLKSCWMCALQTAERHSCFGVCIGRTFTAIF
nr:MAG TPA: hypothetical protein [Caudoviricetes sp.]